MTIGTRTLLIVAAALVLSVGAPTALAATFLVTKVADTADGVCDADCSLREAIVAANAAGGAHVIDLNPTLGTYTLSIFPVAGADTADSGDLDIAGGVTITLHGNGAVIQAAGNGDRIFEVKPGGTFNLDHVTVEGGFGSSACFSPDDAAGGGILNSGTLTLSHVTVRNNASGCGVGGGVANSGVATIDSSTISANSAYRGGGVANVSAGKLTITGSTIASNEGTSGGGGGIYNTMLNNTQNRLTVTASTIAQNSGGGLLSLGQTTLTNVTVADNVSGRACFAGGITNGVCGSGLIGPFVTVVNSLIARNSNRPDPNAADCADFLGSFGSFGNNLSGTPGSCRDLRSEIVAPDPKLGTLGSFGGATQTIPLLTGSLAIDAGNDAKFRGTDQRGFPTFGPTSDIGAFEHIAGASASFTVSTAAPGDGQLVTFTNTSSTTNPGALSFSWDFGDGTTTTTASPTHAFAAPSGPVTYTVTLQVVDALGSADQVSQSITASPAGSLVLTQQPGNAFLGGSFGVQPVVEVRDSAGTLVTTSTAAVTASIRSGPGTTLGGTTTVNAVGGVATFTNLQIDVAGLYVLEFASPGTSSAFSNAFNVLGSTVQGHVHAAATTNPVSGAKVEVCNGTSCVSGLTDASGAYAIVGVVPGSVLARAFPPTDTTLTLTLAPASIAFTVPGAGAVTTGHDFNLPAVIGPPSGTTIGPTLGSPGGIPLIRSASSPTLRTSGQCAGGTAAYAVKVNGSLIRSGGMAEGPAGTYTATFTGPGRPGLAEVTITINCPSGPPTVILFDLFFIDPSGVVQRPDGSPIAGATVTLFHLDAASGQFVPVPNGAVIMSPANRANPDLTGALGQFAWDTLSGTYKVRAQKAGCSATDGGSFVETVPFDVPPPKTDIVLVLVCPDTAPPVIVAHPDVLVVTHDAHAASVAVVYTPPDVTDDVDLTHPATCSPASGSLFPLGSTTVRCSATDAAGNHALDTFFNVIVSFVDNTPPVIAAHPDMHVVTHDAHATSVAVTYTLPSASDDHDPSVTVSCSPASGSLFVVGHTAVTCSAVDAAGNHAVATTFDVWVEFVPLVDPAALLNQLAADVKAAPGLKKGLRSDLVESLNAAVRALSKRPPNVSSACESLADFADQLRERAGKQGLTAAQAAAWLARAHDIAALIGCTSDSGEGEHNGGNHGAGGNNNHEHGH